MGNESNYTAEFDAVYSEYRTRVYSYAFQITKNRDDAEDITQEVFLCFFVMSRCETIANPKGWLAKVTRFRALNLIRAKRHEVLLGEEEAEQLQSPDVMEQFFDKMWQADVVECSGVIMQALKEHNKKWFDAVNLMYCLGMSGNEVAQCLGMSRNALDCMVRRAKQWIRARYSKMLGEVFKI